jgi:hypothetical protein
LQPIDDDEFNIPPLEFEPTLESIMNDMDNQSLTDDEEHAHDVHAQSQMMVLDPMVTHFNGFLNKA